MWGNIAKLATRTPICLFLCVVLGCSILHCLLECSQRNSLRNHLLPDFLDCRWNVTCHSGGRGEGGLSYSKVRCRRKRGFWKCTSGYKNSLGCTLYSRKIRFTHNIKWVVTKATKRPYSCVFVAKKHDSCNCITLFCRTVTKKRYESSISDRRKFTRLKSFFF